MAVHFNIQNQPDGFASRGFVVFGIPLLMAALQVFCCFVNDINAYKHGERRKGTEDKSVFLLIPYTLISIIYGVRTGRR